VAFGPMRPGAEGAGARMRLLMGGDVRDEGPVRGDPEATVRTAARLLDASERLETGDRVLAGSSCHVPAGPGDAVAAEIDGLGRVEARIAQRADGLSPPTTFATPWRRRQPVRAAATAASALSMASYSSRSAQDAARCGGRRLRGRRGPG
jgi:hypothetical protein